jgi:hypothetical protein
MTGGLIDGSLEDGTACRREGLQTGGDEKRAYGVLSGLLGRRLEHAGTLRIIHGWTAPPGCRVVAIHPSLRGAFAA